MKIKSIAECSLGAFCNTFDLHYAIIGLKKHTIFWTGFLRQVLLYTIKFRGYPIWEVKKNNFPTDRPIPVKQGRVRGNKNIFKVGLKWQSFFVNIIEDGQSVCPAGKTHTHHQIIKKSLNFAQVKFQNFQNPKL